MQKKENHSNNVEKFLTHQQNVQNFFFQISCLDDLITKMTGILDKFRLDLETVKVLSLGSTQEERNDAGIRFRHPAIRPISGFPLNIIPFPGNPRFETNKAWTDKIPVSTPLLAMPGKLLPLEIPDFRSALQRDGLILLAWDKRITENGERYTAYWVTSTGIPRFYASKLLPSQDFPSARPDHKSYAAEDGIEFYGQKAPVYIVHVAPELMMSNPQHGELRQTHIEKMKQQGNNVDFSYKYLLKTEKNRSLPLRKSAGGHHHRLGC